MLRHCQHDEVFHSIILSVAVAMMHLLRPQQWSAKHLFHEEAMFRNITLRVRLWMFWGIEHHIALAAKRTTAFPFMRLFSTLGMAMSGQKGKGIASKVTFLAPSIRRRICRLFAATFAQTSRDLFRCWNIGFLGGPSLLSSQTHMMASYKPSLRVFVPSLWNDGLAATTFTRLHRLYDNRSMKGCQLEKEV